MFRLPIISPKLRNSKEKREYQIELNHLKRDFFQNISAIFFCFEVFLISINPFDTDRLSPKTFVLNIVVLLSNIFLGWLAKKKLKYMAIFCIINSNLINNIWFIENLPHIEALSGLQLILIGNIFQIFQIALLIFPIGLKFYLPILAFLSFYSLFRIKRSSFSTSDPSLYYCIALFFVFNLIICWSVEKQSIYRFLLKKKQEENYLNFKKLIDDSPTAFLIAKKEKLVYYNKTARKYFTQIKPNSPLISEHEEFEMILKSRGIQDLTGNGVENLMSEENADHLIIFQTDSHKESVRRLSDIFKSFVGGNQKSIDIEKSCLGQLTISTGMAYNLEFAMSDIEWEGENGQLLTISESSIMEKYLNVKHENERKDKLIANVSHDLRTPLNGIMGLTNLIHELISDKEIHNL